MPLWRKVLFGLILVGMVVLIILTWGSMASGCLALALIMSLPIYLFNRFANPDRENDFVDEGY